MPYPNHLKKVVLALRALPGVGEKTAERYAFQLLKFSKGRLQELGQLLENLREQICTCEECGCLKERDENCTFCTSPSYNHSSLCIVSSPKDVFAIEQTGEYRGLYHVLDGLLSPMEGKGPEAIRVDHIKGRIQKLQIEEVIIALDATLEGDATALYLKETLGSPELSISRLAFGLPMGSPLSYVDGGTLARAFHGRQVI